jgi:Uma2 family endonuclease
MTPATKGAAATVADQTSRGIYRFSVAQYQRMDALFGSEKVEMLEGFVVYKNRPGPAPPPPLPLPPEYARMPLYTFTIAQYQQMEKDGLFGSDRVELLDGYVVSKCPMNPPHIASLGRVNRQLSSRLPPGWYVRLQSDLSLTDSQPLPDAAVVVGTNDDDYATQHPTPDDVALIVEVADSTLDEDRTTKLARFARARIVVYWIVNIPERQLEVYTRPVAGQNPPYRGVLILAATETVSVTIAGTTVGPIAIADLLPPA